MKLLHIVVLIAITAASIGDDIDRLKIRRDRLDAQIKQLERRGTGGPVVLSDLGKEVFDTRMVKPDKYTTQNKWKVRLAAPMGKLARKPFTGLPICGIAEVCLPANEQEAALQNQRLAEWKALGYNTVLYVWEPKDSYSAIATFLDSLKEQNWQIVLTLSNDQTASVYFDIAALDGMLYYCGSRFAATLPLWRNGDLCHWKDISKAAAFVAVVSQTLRAKCPDMPIFGSAYLMPELEVLAVVPEWCFSVFISNVGFSNCNPEKLKRLMERTIGKQPMAVLVVGAVPYYASYYRRETYVGQTEMATKVTVAQRFRSAGFETVVLFGDGSGGVEYNSRAIPDALTKKIKEPKSK